MVINGFYLHTVSNGSPIKNVLCTTHSDWLVFISIMFNEPNNIRFIFLSSLWTETRPVFEHCNDSEMIDWTEYQKACAVIDKVKEILLA